MAKESKYSLKKILLVSMWIMLLSGGVVLLIAAISKKRNEVINSVEIKISGIQNNYFIGKKEVLEILEKLDGKKLAGQSIHSLDLTTMEATLEKNIWIKKAEIFFDNNNILQVRISEREPIVRIFTNSGSSFYIDSSLTRLPLSEKFSARLPVFSAFPDVAKKFSKQDSNLLRQVKILSEYINEHPFWMAQIDQVNITPQNTFELIPKLGDQLIRFGDTENYEEKFNKLLAFYQQVESKVGWNKYSVLDIRFKSQVVGVNRDAAEIKSDSLKSVEIMKNIIEEAQKNSNDSTKIQLPQPKNGDMNVNTLPAPVQSVPKKEASSNGGSAPASNATKEVEKKETSKEKKPATKQVFQKKKPVRESVKKEVLPVKKEAETTTPEIKKEPKTVMPSKSDY